jgi:hypothetical protein
MCSSRKQKVLEMGMGRWEWGDGNGEMGMGRWSCFKKSTPLARVAEKEQGGEPKEFRVWVRWASILSFCQYSISITFDREFGAWWTTKTHSAANH